MSTIRIAVASTPLTATLEEAVPAAVAAVEEAGRLGAAIVCLPETGTARTPRPGPARAGRVDRTRSTMPSTEVADAARRAGVVTIVGTERPTPAGREIVSVVLGADGDAARRAGEDADRPDGGAALHRRAGAGACSRPRA